MNPERTNGKMSRINECSEGTNCKWLDFINLFIGLIKKYNNSHIMIMVLI